MSDVHYEMFLHACKHGRTEIVRLLLPFVDPALQESLGFQYACEYGHIAIVRLLLASGKVNVEARNGYPFRIALRNKHVEIAKLLGRP
jgi:hypothetical protein